VPFFRIFKFKNFYKKQVKQYWNTDFKLFHTLDLLKRKLIIWPLLIFLSTRRLSKCTGISFIDSFKLESCNLKRASSHKTMKLFAQKGKTSRGWFYGMKVRLIVNHKEIVSFYISTGNVSDNNEVVLFRLTKNIIGKLFYR
jgi:Transposase DDE domain